MRGEAELRKDRHTGINKAIRDTRHQVGFLHISRSRIQDKALSLDGTTVRLEFSGIELSCIPGVSIELEIPSGEVYLLLFRHSKILHGNLVKRMATFRGEQ